MNKNKQLFQEFGKYTHHAEAITDYSQLIYLLDEHQTHFEG